LKKYFFFFISITINFYLSASERGISRVEIKTLAGETVGLYEESHALIIGVSDYTNGWPTLPGVRKDVKAVKSALESHGFNVETALNPKDYHDLDKTFNSFISKHGRKQNNRLLFYFAGHGHTLTKNYGEKMGYIIPANSPNPNRDINGFLNSSMDMQQIEVYAKRIDSKHALFIFDSCFSGSIFALSRAIPENISYKTAKPVRQFITSGNAEEQVPDTSIFRRQFVAALNGEGDTDGDRYVTAIELGEFLQKTVINYSKGSQHPQYGKIRNPNLDKGDFVFALPGVEKMTPPNVAVIPNVNAPPETSGLQLDTLIQQAETQEKAKQELERIQRDWSEWQARMQTDFEQAESFEQRDVTPGLKIEPWRQFITAYGANNPFTDSDEQLRERAQKRLGYWRRETQRRAEAQKQKQNTVSIEPETASVTQQQASPPPQAPADPKAETYFSIKSTVGLINYLEFHYNRNTGFGILQESQTINSEENIIEKTNTFGILFNYYTNCFQCNTKVFFIFAGSGDLIFQTSTNKSYTYRVNYSLPAFGYQWFWKNQISFSLLGGLRIREFINNNNKPSEPYISNNTKDDVTFYPVFFIGYTF